MGVFFGVLAHCGCPVFPTASFASPTLRDWELDLNLQLTPSSDLHLNSWSEKERASFRAVISLLNEDQGGERICRNAWSFAEAFQLERKIQGFPYRRFARNLGCSSIAYQEPLGVPTKLSF